VGQLTFSGDGNRLAVAGTNSLVVVDVSTGKLVREISGLPVAFALSPDGSMVAVEGAETGPNSTKPAGMRVVRLADSVEVALHAPPFVGPDCDNVPEDCGLISPIIWEPRGRFLVFPDGYNTVRVWNPFAKASVDVTVETRWLFGGIAVSPDGTQLAIGNGDFVSVFTVSN
jgi:WD40 repeat protein